MKTKLILLAALFTLVSTSVSARSYNQQSDFQSQNSNHHSQTRIYKIGDVYEENGKKGVVFSISNNGKHGRIVSIQETQCSWEDAKVWCSQLGNDWTMPTKQDLKTICYLRINKDIITQFNKESSWRWDVDYWTGNEAENDESSAIIVYMHNGLAYRTYKFNHNYVRAVSTF